MPDSKERKRERYQERRKAGICSNCGKMPAKRLARCQWCRDAEKRYIRQPKVKTKEYGRSWYASRRAKGLCVSCGLDAAGKSRCDVCQQRFRDGRCRRRKMSALSHVLANFREFRHVEYTEPRRRGPQKVNIVALPDGPGKVALSKASAKHGVYISEMTGRNNHNVVVNARRDVAKDLRAQGWSLSRIGLVLNKHHTTVMNLIATEQVVVTESARKCFIRARKKRADSEVKK